MPEIDAEVLGKINFTAYCEAVGWKNYAGASVPPWSELGPDIQAAWVAGAAAVEEVVQQPSSVGIEGVDVTRVVTIFIDGGTFPVHSCTYDGTYIWAKSSNTGMTMCFYALYVSAFELKEEGDNNG